jgi:hypothetical protein
MEPGIREKLHDLLAAEPDLAQRDVRSDNSARFVQKLLRPAGRSPDPAADTKDGMLAPRRQILDDARKILCANFPRIAPRPLLPRSSAIN